LSKVTLEFEVGYNRPMANVTQILSHIEDGDPNAADQLLPLVYAELRKLAAAKLAQEKPGQTLQATALVHEAYLRLVGGNHDNRWEGRRHFFAAAAEAMRRLLVEKARHRTSQKAGGEWQRVELDQAQLAKRPEVDLPVLNDALDLLEAHDPRKAAIVKLRYFVGLTVREAADALGISPATADNDWAYAKSWLKLRLEEREEDAFKTVAGEEKSKNT
jgi:RNA polymerase sigma factor (TIGR02999 family)